MSYRHQRKLRQFIPFIRIAAFLLPGIVIVLLMVKLVGPMVRYAVEGGLTPGPLVKTLMSPLGTIRGLNGRTNIAIFGMAGGTHDGPDLTDSIIFLSVDSVKKDVVLVSLPRDLWLPSLKAKINTAYHYGEEKKPGGGLILAKSAVSEVVGQPVQYAAVIDFTGFRDIIDQIGGVEVVVDKAFVDKEFPVAGKENDMCDGDPTLACRYQTVEFVSGKQHMDGTRALIYVRSRHAADDEGTDFARSRRQQEVIAALKEKILTMQLWRQPGKVMDLITIVDKYVKSDLSLLEKVAFGKMFIDMRNSAVRKLVMDSGDIQQKKKGYLMNPPVWEYDGAWVLIPRAKDFSEIQAYISCNLDSPTCPLKP
jgi:polyisoprenyl-teichoic acid--peptidoglycan teichoic acid transferase